MDHQEIYVQYEIMDWIYQIADGGQWRAVLSTVIKLLVTQRADNLLTSLATTSITRTVYHGVGIFIISDGLFYWGGCSQSEVRAVIRSSWTDPVITVQFFKILREYSL
jgi:hypothetical protein